MQDAQKRLREANRNLDLAIYADSIDETSIQFQLKEVQTAQAEVQKIRAMSELEIRKILTPEQLVIFRDLRENFANRLRNNQQRRQNRRQNNKNRPINNQNRNLPKRQ
jgi:Spy/CpxP family protein refolding chaperone